MSDEQATRIDGSVIIGVDYGHDEWVTECAVRPNPDGSMTVISMNRWKARQTIDLEAYKPASPSP